MKMINIHEAKTQLSKLVEEAADGDAFLIAKAGRPMVKVIRIDAPASSQARRLGFLAGHMTVPEDFDTMGAAHIAALFGVAD